jgi:hypothetical protein
MANAQSICRDVPIILSITSFVPSVRESPWNHHLIINNNNNNNNNNMFGLQASAAKQFTKEYMKTTNGKVKSKKSGKSTTSCSRQSKLSNDSESFASRSASFTKDDVSTKSSSSSIRASSTWIGSAKHAEGMVQVRSSIVKQQDRLLELEQLITRTLNMANARLGAGNKVGKYKREREKKREVSCRRDALRT